MMMIMMMDWGVRSEANQCPQREGRFQMCRATLKYGGDNVKIRIKAVEIYNVGDPASLMYNAAKSKLNFALKGTESGSTMLMTHSQAH